MNPLPIRLRLTAWYLAALSFTLALAFFGTYFAIEVAIHHVIDQELASRLASIHTFLWRHLPWQSGERLLQEFREHSGLTPGGDLYQVRDAGRQWVYQPLAMKRLNLASGPERSGPMRYETLERNGILLRMLTARVEVANRPYTVQIASVITPFSLLLRRLRWLAIAILPILVLCSGFGGYWLSGRAMAPIDEITRAARDIGERNLSKRLPLPQARDELRRLSETLNSMLSRLEAAFKRIVQFTADASHELRTPIAIIRTTAEVMREQPRTVAEYEEANTQIVSEAERTSELIENLLTLARADSQAAQFVFYDLNFNKIVNEVLVSVAPLAEVQGFRLNTKISGSPVVIVGDRDAIRRLIIIFVDNAIKYSSPGSNIWICVDADQNGASFEVRDEGIGISDNDLPHIFERFYRADKARSRDMGGAGLGLSIAKWIADAHRASIEVHSELGRGSTFKVKFPVAS
jgi:heavy metal sensor kinase